MNKSEPSLNLNLKMRSEELEGLISAAMDKYVESIIKSNLDACIKKYLEKRINKFIDARSWDNEGKLDGKTFEQFVKEKVDQSLSHTIEAQAKELMRKKLLELTK